MDPTGYELAEIFQIRMAGVPFDALEGIATPRATALAREIGDLQLRQEPQGTSDFRLRSQGPCRLGTGESGLVLG
ncbi:MAG TPA: hypothetical protein VIV57_21050 [Anaeromyxobacter sp.]